MRVTALWLALALLMVGCGRSQPKSETTAAQPSVAIDPATSGTITGVVDFEGTPPKRATIDMSEDPGCAMANKEPVLAETIVANHGKLENVFVYVKDGLGNYIIPKPSGPAVLDQVGCRYVPHVLGLVAGQPLEIKNSDPTSHNIHGAPEKNEPWNDSQMPGAAPVNHTFSTPELLVPISCNQHPWMKMYVNVVSNPFFAVSDAQGRFTISGLPPGQYTLEAVHEKLGTQELHLRLGPKENKSVSFTFLTPAG